MQTENIIVAGACLNQTPLDWQGNLANIAQAITQAKAQNVSVLCLPELCLTGYGCEDQFGWPWVSQKALRYLVEQLAPLTIDGPICSVGLPISYQNKLYNGAAIVWQGKVLGISLKQFLANTGLHYECRWFAPWPKNQTAHIMFENQSIPIGDLTYPFAGFNIGFEICEDAWQNELRPGYELKKRGVNIILNPSASHSAFGKSYVREQIVMAGSADFECVYIYSNLLGNEAGRTIFDGEILIAQAGKLLARNNRFSYQNTNLVSVEICPSDPRFTPDIEAGPDPRDSFNDFAEAVPLALFDYMRKSHTKGFVLSLSGGADSSACAVLVAQMVRRATQELGIDLFFKKLGLPNIVVNIKLITQQVEKQILASLLTCAYQGTKNSSAQTRQSAQELAQSIGASYFEWEIDEILAQSTQIIEQASGQKLDWNRHDIALQNIQARSRAPLIWLLANLQNALLITTSNRSEGDVGYATMDGDMAGSIAPIAGVSKTFVLKWLVYAQKELGYDGLEYVNRLEPSAELRPLETNQTDEADLMPYNILEQIERAVLLDYLPPIQVFERISLLFPDYLGWQIKEYVSRFFRLWAASQWKRERMAPSFHLDDFNIDSRSWCRFPILSAGFAVELDELERLDIKPKI